MSSEKNILIAEDDKAIARALKLKLDHEGYSTEIASNGSEALDILNKNKFDLLVLDLIMPQMDGFSVLAKMKESGVNIPIVVVSNLSQEEDISKAKEMGVVSFFIKSDTPLSQIVLEIKKYLGA